MIVYLITNLINGKRYVGQTSSSLERRWYLHTHRKNCTALRPAIDKYGATNFSIEMICEIPNRTMSDEFEKEYIQRYNTKSPNGYNLTDGGDGLINPSQETRARISRANKGNKSSLGVIRTPEYCKLKSESQIGRIFSEETKTKMSQAAKGRTFSNETKEKLRAASLRLGLRPPKLSKEQLSEVNKKALHTRYHTNRNKLNPNCKFCEVQSSTSSEVKAKDCDADTIK